MHPYIAFLQSCGKEEGYKFKPLVEDYLYLVEKDGIEWAMCGSDFGLNLINASAIMKSKSNTYLLLKNYNVPAVEHEFIINPTNSFYDFKKIGSYEKAKEFWGKYKNQKIVVKSDTGGSGNNVFLVDNEKDFYRTLIELFQLGKDVSISPFYESTFEYRVVLLNQNVKLVYGKERTNNWKHNLQQGGNVIEEIDEKLKKEIIELATKSATVLDANYCTVDILHTDKGLKVIEVNSVVVLEKYRQSNKRREKNAKNIIHQAFEERHKQAKR